MISNQIQMLMTRYIIIIAIIFLPVPQITAQQGQQFRGRGDFEQVEAERIAFLTRYLELSAEEAKQFWPIYDDYQNRRNLLIQERQTMSRYFQQNQQNMTEKEADEIADGYISLQVKETALAGEYHKKFKGALPSKKVMRLYEAENIFRMQLLRRVRGGGGGAGRGNVVPPGGGR